MNTKTETEPTPTATKSTADRMRERRADALAEITRLIWADAAADEIADAALSGGLDADAVQNIESKIMDAKNQIAALEKYDVRELARAVAVAAKAAGKAQVDFERAEQARQVANAIHAEQAELLEAAKNAFTAAANRCRSGELPIEKLPEIVRRLVEVLALRDDATAAGSKAASIRQALRQAEGEVATLEVRREAVAGVQRERPSLITEGGAMKPEDDIIGARLKTLTAQIEQAQKMLVELEKQAAEKTTMADKLEKEIW